MKVLNRRQVIILIVLNAAAVIMATVLLCTGILRRGSTPAFGSSPTPWVVTRSPRPTLNEHVRWETTIGGSGDEEAVALYRTASGFSLIGNTQSSDFDFAENEGEHGFLANLSAAGKIESIVTFDAVRCVTLHEKGFVAGLKNEAGVIGLDDTGAEFKRVVFNGMTPETVVDVKLLETGYAAVTETKTSTDKTALKVYRLDPELNVTQTITLSRGASLRYTDLYETADGLLLAADYVADVRSCLTFVEVKPTPVYHEVTAEYNYTAVAVMPHAKGYAALIVDTDSGFGNLLEISPYFQRVSLHYLNAARPDKGRLFADAKHTYAYFHLGADSSTLTVFDSALTYVNVVADAVTLSALDTAYASGTTSTFFGRTATGISVFTAEGMATRNAFTVDAAADNLLCTKINGGLLLCGTVSSTSADCGQIQGGTDIWIASVV